MEYLLRIKKIYEDEILSAEETCFLIGQVLREFEAAQQQPRPDKYDPCDVWR